MARMPVAVALAPPRGVGAGRGDRGAVASAARRQAGATAEAAVASCRSHRRRRRGPAGYWLVASDGGVFAFGTGSLGQLRRQHLTKPVVGMAADT